MSYLATGLMMVALALVASIVGPAWLAALAGAAAGTNLLRAYDERPCGRKTP